MLTLRCITKVQRLLEQTGGRDEQRVGAEICHPPVYDKNPGENPRRSITLHYVTYPRTWDVRLVKR